LARTGAKIERRDTERRKETRRNNGPMAVSATGLELARSTRVFPARRYDPMQAGIALET
jgi:hypothetical protein